MPVIIILMLSMLAGCSKLTMANYETLKVGMTYAEVVKTIGAPDKCSEAMGMRICEWGNEKKFINVTFAGQKALLFTCNGLR